MGELIIFLFTTVNDKRAVCVENISRVGVKVVDLEIGAIYGVATMRWTLMDAQLPTTIF